MKARFQFRLRTLMIVVTLLAVPCAYVGWQAKIVRERAAALNKLYSLGGAHMSVEEYRSEVAVGFRPGIVEQNVPSVSWIRARLGDEAIIAMYIPPEASASDYQALVDVIPEAIVSQVYQLNKLKQPSATQP